jgi:Folded gastrulation N-terminus
MMKMLYRILLLSWCMFCYTRAYPVESKPLNNDPESWNLNWLIFEPQSGQLNPSSEALVGSDSHIKKSKITPKSIFIAPSNIAHHEKICPSGYRVDDNGKCIKTVTINQDDILAARLSDLFGIDDSSKNTNSDSDYYDFEEDKNENSGPLQISLPLAIDIEEEIDGKKIEYIIEEKVITMRNLVPKIVETTPVAEKLVQKVTTTELPTTTTTNVEETTEIYTKITTEEPTVTTNEVTTTLEPTTTTTTTTTTTRKPIKITTTTTTAAPPTTTTTEASLSTPKSLDLINAKVPRKTNRNGNRKSKPRKQQNRVKTNDSLTLKNQAQTVEQQAVTAPKKNRTRSGVKRRKLSTTQAPVTTTTTLKPYYWLPKGWTIDETKDKPVLVRFWAEQPLPHDERARSHSSRHQRVNSRMPTESIFKEVTVPELNTFME